MWEMTSQGPQTYLDVDALYHVGNCVKTLFLHYKRIRPPTVGESNKVDVEDGDMIIIAGNEKLAFLNPYDAQKPVLRRLSIPEGHVSMAQWRNLVMVGTKAGAIIGRCLSGGIWSWSGRRQGRVSVGHDPDEGGSTVGF